jgi:hypothetical protein
MSVLPHVSYRSIEWNSVKFVTVNRYEKSYLTVKLKSNLSIFSKTAHPTKKLFHNINYRSQ